MWEPGQPEPPLERAGLLWEHWKSLGWLWGRVGELPTLARTEQGVGEGRRPGRQPRGLTLEMHHPLSPVSLLLLRFPRQRVAGWLGLALELGSVPGPEGTWSHSVPGQPPVSYGWGGHRPREGGAHGCKGERELGLDSGPPAFWPGTFSTMPQRSHMFTGLG